MLWISLLLSSIRRLNKRQIGMEDRAKARGRSGRCLSRLDRQDNKRGAAIAPLFVYWDAGKSR